MSVSLFRASFVACTLIFLNSPMFAQERANEFAFSDQQLRALGIELIALHVQPITTGARFPAQVVLPPQQQRTVSAPVAGLINQVLVEENQAIKAGTPLLVMSSPEFDQLQLALVQTANRARLTAQTAERERALFKEGIIPLRRVQEADAAESDSQAALVQAKAALSLSGMGQSAINRIASKGEVNSQLTLVAPVAGVVVDLEAKPGQRVSEASPLLRLAKLDRLWIDIQVPSTQATLWPKGAKLIVDGGIEAQVLSLSPLANSAQTVTLRAVVIQGTDRLRPGEFVQVQLPVTAPNAWEVPLSTLAREGDQAVVFVRAKDKFVAVPVQVLANAGQRAQISGALKAGDQIAVSGAIALKAAWQDTGSAEEK